MTLLQNIKGNTAPPPKTMATNLSGQPSSNFKKILIIVLDKKVQLCFAMSVFGKIQVLLHRPTRSSLITRMIQICTRKEKV